MKCEIHCIYTKKQIIRNLDSNLRRGIYILSQFNASLQFKVRNGLKLFYM